MAQKEQNKIQNKSARRITGSVATPSGCALIYYRAEETQYKGKSQNRAQTTKRDK